MEANLPMPEGDKNQLPAESQTLNQPLSNPYKIELSYRAVNRLARILAEIAESNSKNSTKPNQNE
jgi:hypothetical protein